MSENYTLDAAGGLRGFECPEPYALTNVSTRKTAQNENIYDILYSFFGIYALAIVCVILILRSEKLRRDYNKKRVNVRTVYSV